MTHTKMEIATVAALLMCDRSASDTKIDGMSDHRLNRIMAQAVRFLDAAARVGTAPMAHDEDDDFDVLDDADI